MQIFYLYFYIIVAVCTTNTKVNKSDNSTQDVEILGFDSDGYIVSQEERSKQINHPRFNDMCIITFLSESNPVVLVDQYKKYRFLGSEENHTDKDQSSRNNPEKSYSRKNDYAENLSNGIRSKGIQAEEIHSKEIQTEENHSEENQAEEIHSEENQAEEIHSEEIQSEDYSYDETNSDEIEEEM